MLIEIASTEPPPEGKKMGKVAGAMGESLYAWPNIIEKLKIGSRYEVEIADMGDFNGRPGGKKITKIKPAVASAKAGDNVIPPGNPAAPAAAPDAEMVFVRELLAVAVRTGAVAFSPHDLRAAIALLRTLWREQSRQ